MTSNAINRETARDYLATLLNADLVTTRGYAVAVYGYMKSKLGGLSPVVIVASAGSAREQKGMGTDKHRNRFRYIVKVLVRDADTAAGWTEQAAEDRLDLLEKTIADVVMNNRSQAQNVAVPWQRLHLESFESGEFSRLVFIPDIDGAPYIMEEIPVIAEMHD